MAKKQATMGYEDQYPTAVLDAAEAYDRAHTAKSKASGKVNTAKENLITAMRENDCKKAPIRGGDKFLELTETEKIMYRKPKANSTDEGDDTLFDKE